MIFIFEGVCGPGMEEWRVNEEGTFINKVNRNFELGSYLMNLDGYEFDVEEEVTGDRRFVKAKVVAPDGKTMSWNEVFVREGKI